MSVSDDAAAPLASFIEAAINEREIFLEQLQLFVTGAMRHPQLIDKEGQFEKSSNTK